MLSVNFIELFKKYSFSMNGFETFDSIHKTGADF